MKRKVLGIAMAMALTLTLILGSVQVSAAVNAYGEWDFVDLDDYEQDEVNPFHQDVIKFEGNIGGTFVGAWLEYDNIGFGTVGAVAVKVNYCNNSGRCAADSALEIWIDGRSESDGGTKVGTVPLPATGGDWSVYEDTEVALDTVVTGDHDVYFVMTGSTSESNPFISNLMYFEFIKGEGEEEPTPTPEETATPEETPTPTEAPTAAPETSAPATSAPVTSAPAATDAGNNSATATPADDTTTEDNSGDSTLIIVIAVVAVVVVAAAVASYLILKKKKG